MRVCINGVVHDSNDVHIIVEVSDFEKDAMTSSTWSTFTFFPKGSNFWDMQSALLLFELQKSFIESERP